LTDDLSNVMWPTFPPRFVSGRSWFAALAAGLLLSSVSALVYAKGEPTQSVGRASKAGVLLLPDASDQSIALDLVRYGDRKKDAMALIQAARMQQALGTQVKEGSPLSQAMLLQRARSYSNGRADLALLIDDVAASSLRGSQTGPILEHFLAPVNELQKLIVRFTGGVRATFSLNAEEPQKIEIEVLDAQGKPVCVRSGAATRECSWTPSATGDYQIRIRNVGSTASEYSVFHN
jgi:hypothetical protein